MEQTENMIALKKAYAEIILNTAKEAAERVMMAERKALRYQHDLRATKDEALRMLLRLKHVFDAKTQEAEITSLSQQKKIEELDAQLNEAEGVILDLRAELRTAQDQLEEVKNERMEHGDQQIKRQKVYMESETHDRNADTSGPFTASLPIGKCRDLAKCSHFDTFLADNPKLASIIKGSRESELYRNGCTQRIRAFERSFLDEDLLSETLADQSCLRRNEEAFNMEVKNGACTACSTKTEIRGTNCQVGSNVLPVSSVAEKDQPVKFRKLPRKITWCVKSRATSFRFRHCQSTKHRRSSLAFPYCKRVMHTDNNNAKTGVDGNQAKILAEKNDSDLCNLRRSFRKRKIRRWDEYTTSSKSLPSQFKETCAPGSVLSSCKKHWGKYGVRSSEHRPKEKYETEIRNDIGTAFTSRPTEQDKVSGFIHDNADDDTGLIEIFVQGEGEARDLTEFSSCNIDIVAEKVQSEDLKATYGTARQTDRDSILKYTFSRKRKKDQLSKSNDCSSLGNNSTNCRIGEIVNISSDLESSLMSYSSDCQDAVPNACQLISLSGE